jgi:hypothetical protein
MRINQDIFENNHWITLKTSLDIKPQLVLCFGKREILIGQNWLAHLHSRFPKATIVSTSTSGEVSNNFFSEDSIVATAIEFEQTKTFVACVNVKAFDNSSHAGTALAAKLPTTGLRFVLLFSDGMLVNGGDLVVAINEVFENKIPVAGGMAGDGEKFNETVVGVNGDIEGGNIVAIGFYGENLKLGFGSKGGWNRFGPARTITRSNKNILHDLDGENALDLYKKYLGRFADELPGAALHFPLALESKAEEVVVRTILSIDEENKTMTFAGNMPQGAIVRFMKTTHHNLTEAASSAAETSAESLPASGEKLAIVISCVGRKIILGSRVDEEFEVVREALDKDTTISGFYSHGEIAPYGEFTKCSLYSHGYS